MKHDQETRLAFHILDTLDDNPLTTLVALPLFDYVFLLLAWVNPRNDTKRSWGREWTTSRSRYTCTLLEIGRRENVKRTMGVLHVVTDKRG